MEWVNHLNRAVAHIEERIEEEIDFEEVAKIACCSTYHFQRMFAYMAGMPLSEYVRRRRMSLAAVDLQHGDKVIDVAIKYSYSSPTAFNRAFQSIHGIAPSAAREEGVSLKSFPPIRFKFTVTGAEEMNYRIEKKDAFRIIGVASRLDNDIENNFEVVPKLWQQAAMDGTVQKLAEKISKPPMGILGISANVDKDEWRYFLAIASDDDRLEGWEEYTVPAFTWAIFEGAGQCPQAIQELERRIVTEWLPSSGYEYDDGPDVEVYKSPNPQNAVFEVWIPVVKK